MTLMSKSLAENDIDVNNFTSILGNFSENDTVVRVSLFDFYQSHGSDKGVYDKICQHQQ